MHEKANDFRFEYAFPDGGYIVGMRGMIGGDFKYYYVNGNGAIVDEKHDLPDELWDIIKNDPVAFARNSRVYIEMAKEKRHAQQIRQAYEYEYYQKEKQKLSARDRAAKQGVEQLGEEFASLLNSMMKFNDR